MSKAVKVWARKARVALLCDLGAFCHWPGCAIDARRGGGLDRRRMKRLTFDHIEGKDWEATGKSTDQRMVIYRREAAEGMLQVLCREHNEVKGDPQGRPSWRELWFRDLYAGSFGERTEA